MTRAFVGFALFYAFAGCLAGVARVGAHSLLGRESGTLLSVAIQASTLWYFLCNPPNALRAYPRSLLLDLLGLMMVQAIFEFGPLDRAVADPDPDGERRLRRLWIQGVLVLLTLSVALVRSRRAGNMEAKIP